MQKPCAPSTGDLKLSWKADLDVHRMVSEGDGSSWSSRADRRLGPEDGQGTVRKDEKTLDVADLHRACGLLVLEKSTLRDDPIGCGIRSFPRDGELLWTEGLQPDMTIIARRAPTSPRVDLGAGGKGGPAGLRAKNGSERKQWATRGKHCAAPVATERFFPRP